MDRELVARLVDSGVDPGRIVDAAAAWLQLHDHAGQRATILDRYSLEAHVRGVRLDRLGAGERRRLAAEVLRARDAAFELAGQDRPHEPVEVVPYDPRWPDEFVRWRRRIAGVLGDVAMAIEHVGSTAVPGLAAKPVIDVMISVRDVDDEAAYVPAVESLGLPMRARETQHRYFRPPPGRPRDVHIHVCSAGGAWEAEHLRFRDALRADEELRDGYGELKLLLSRRHRDDRLVYTDEKTRFILDTLASVAG